jgi:hypothetical protein
MTGIVVGPEAAPILKIVRGDDQEIAHFETWSDLAAGWTALVARVAELEGALGICDICATADRPTLVICDGCAASARASLSGKAGT